MKRTPDPSILHASVDPALKSEQERIASLYDSLAAELRDKLNGALSGRNPPLLLPPKDYDPHQHPQHHSQQYQQQHSQLHPSNKTQDHDSKKSIQRLLKPYTDNGSSSGLSSGIGSDLDDTAVNKQQQQQHQQQQELRRQRSEERHLSRNDNHRSIPNLRRKDSGNNCRSLDFGSSTDFSSFESTHNIKR